MKSTTLTQQLFSPLVGEFLIASAAGRGGEPPSEAELSATQEARVSRLADLLRARLKPFADGEAEAFAEVQSINASQLAAASFGEVLLQAIGGVYANEAATALGGGNPFAVGVHRLKRAGASVRSQLQAAQAAVSLAQHQARVDAADEALRAQAAALKQLEEAGEALPEEARAQLYGLMEAR